MNEWILIVPMLAFALLALAGWLVAWKTQRNFTLALMHYTAVQEEKTLLYSQNADLREALQECIAERDSLKLDLSKVHATKPMQPSMPIKRISRKKEEAEP